MSISVKYPKISESMQSSKTEILTKTGTLLQDVAKKKALLKKKSKKISAIKLNQLTFLRLSLASPKRIKKWSQRLLSNGEIIGEVTNANTVNYKTLNPEKGGLFCERVFGPVKDFQCSCGKQKSKSHPKVCPNCGVEFISSQNRRYKMGYIQLVVPVTHVWYLKNAQNSIISVLLDLKKKELEAVTYCFSKFSLNRKLFSEDLMVQNIWPLIKANPFFFRKWAKKKKKNSLNSWKDILEFHLKFSKMNVCDQTQRLLRDETFWQPQTQICFLDKNKYWDLFISNTKILVKKKKVLNFQFKNLPFFLIQKNQSFQNFFFQNSNSLLKTSSLFQNLRADFEQKKVFSSKQNFKKLSFNFNKNFTFLYSTFLKRFYKQNFHFFLPFPAVSVLKSKGFGLSASFSYRKFCKVGKNQKVFTFNQKFFSSNLFEKNFQISEYFFQKKLLLTFSKPFLKQNRLILNSNFQNSFSLLSYQIFFKALLKIENYWISPHKFSKKTYAFFENFLNDNFLAVLPELSLRQKYEEREHFLQAKQLLKTLVTSDKAWKSSFFKKRNAFKQTQTLSSASNVRSTLNLNLKQKNCNLNFSRKQFKDLNFFRKNPLGNLNFRSFFYFKLLPSLKIALIISRFKKGKKYESKKNLIYFQNLLDKLKFSPFLNLKIKPALLKKKSKSLQTQIQSLEYFHKLRKNQSLNLIKNFDQKPNFEKPYWDEATSSSFVLPFFSNFALNLQRSFRNAKLANQMPKSDFIPRNLSSIDQFSSLIRQKLKIQNASVTLTKKKAFVGKEDFCSKEKFLWQGKIFPGQSEPNFVARATFSSNSIGRQSNLIESWNSQKLAYFRKKLTKSFFRQKPVFCNNFYLLSQNFQWTDQEDWVKFCNYIAPKANQTDSLIPSYVERGGCLDIVSTGAGSLKVFLSALNQLEKKNFSSLNLLLKSLCQTFLHYNQEIHKIENSSKLFSQIPKAFLIFNKQADFDKEVNLRFQRLSRLEILRAKLLRRLKLIRGLIQNQVSPEWMVLNLLPVLPPTLRPLLSLEGQQVAVSDLNKFYQTILFRNKRLKRFSQGYYTKPSISMPTQQKYAQRLLQEAVDALIENGKGDSPIITASNNRPLKSLSDMLKGKKGRFRQNLLGKRVDYSGRSVIVVGPQLKLHQCGLPKEMALVLFQPFLIRQLILRGIASNFIGAKKLLKLRPNNFLSLLQEIMENQPVLLNRAPTLHRLGIQAFQPILVSGRAILLHPLVCTAFNADFDGDQMAVHIPLSLKACSEAWKLMSSRNSLLSPATGEPVLLPSQDMVLGCYYLTTLDQIKTKAKLKQSAFLLPHCNQAHSLSTIENEDKKQSLLQNRKLLQRKKFQTTFFLNRVQRKKKFKIENSLNQYYSNWNQVLQSLNQQNIYLHSPIWFQWNKNFEFSFKRENLLELRLDKFGNGLFIRQTSQNYWNSKFETKSFYLKTTPGRVLINFFIFEIHSQSILKKN
uniref:DNA-directed RNA polymerase subunit beta' n=1 Tax=Gloeotilopsis planctonica TaxID=34157 RepID=A0A1B2RZ52_9CHLO|nr:beta' subunit of RNA polymerase [Gloeotilopsis planctonica]